MSKRSRFQHGRLHLGSHTKPVKRWRKTDWSFWEGATRAIRKCGDKICGHADEIEEVRLKQERISGYRLRCYFHHECGFFHLTSKV